MPTDGPPLPIPDADPVDAATLESMRVALEAQVHADRGPLAGVRSWPTMRRRAVLSLLIGGLALVATVRGGGSLTMALALDVVAMVLAWVSLRPIYRPTPPAWVEALVPLGSLALLATMGWLTDAGIQTHGSQHLRCFGPGIAIGASTLLVWRVLTGQPTGFQSFAAASAAGVAANAFLAARCALPSAEHVLLGHASVLAVLVALVWVADLLRGRVGGSTR